MVALNNEAISEKELRKLLITTIELHCNNTTMQNLDYLDMDELYRIARTITYNKTEWKLKFLYQIFRGQTEPDQVGGKTGQNIRTKIKIPGQIGGDDDR